MNSSSEKTSNSLEQLLAQDTSENWPNKKYMPFSRIFATIKSKFDTHPQQPTANQSSNSHIIEQQQQAQEYLDNGYYGFYLTMLRHDYQPTVEQKSQFKDKLHKICERLSHGKSYELWETHLKEGGTLDMDVMFHLMVQTRNDDYHYFFKELAEGKKDSFIHNNYPLLAKTCEDFVAKPDFSRQFMTRWLEEVQQLNEKSQYPYWHFEQLQQGLLKRLEQKPECFLKDITLTETIDIVKKAHTVMEQMDESMKVRHYNNYNGSTLNRENIKKIITVKLPKVIENHYKNDIVSRMQQTRANYSATGENVIKNSAK
jgi:hypothetical protein